MEWVETIGRSVDEAKEKALDQLGVSADDAEFEVLDEPRPGLFGRLRGEARVRARVRRTQARPKVERSRRKKRPDEVAGTDADADTGVVDDGEVAPEPEPTRARRERRPEGRERLHERGPATPDDRAPDRPRDPDAEPVDPELVADAAASFLQGLAQAFGTEAQVAVERDGTDLELTVSGADLGVMVGPRGSTLLAIQDITRVASQRRLGDHETRLRVDIAGYRERRRQALTRFAQKIADEVSETGVARVLEPMPSADRKVVHDVLSEHAAVSTRSEGDDPYRCVVIAPVG